MAKSYETSENSVGKRKGSQPDFASWSQSLLKANEVCATSKPSSQPPTLYLVATPIGNLGDITLRALWTLSFVDAVLCEDTRVTGGLIHHYGIKKPLISCHDHNEEARSAEVISRLQKGESLALVSDAGTPMISDPGFRLVRAVREAGFTVVAAPGASALLTALASAGLPTDRFLFVGFLSSKSTARRKAIAALAATQATLVFYESAQRLAATLSDLATTLSPNREAAVGRELTKLYEEMQTAPLGKLAAHYADAETPKGEIVILVGPPTEDEAVPAFDLDEALRDALATMTLRDAVAAVTKSSGLKKSEVYAKALLIEG
ncbi:MAG: 16S rRNA (cytidine(1402)-2'-O)-methyltransferase [Alphaproteobacteria bacterium]|nr:16S rRNA (cytidine(1402)-2'-O)-methyltransferase [Alphaproteobacteria bacterium]